MDHLSKIDRSRNMAAIKSKNTKPEVKVRSMLHSLGYRFRIHRKDLPGTPDIVLPRYNTVIFVHGCFWHGHKNCKRAGTPKSNKNYWVPKIQKNISRDKQHQKELKKNGWNVFTLWECETKDEKQLRDLLKKFLRIIK